MATVRPMIAFGGPYAKPMTVMPSASDAEPSRPPAAVATACSADDYILQGRKLLEAVNLKAEGAPARYSPLDALWRHPETGATFYVGGSSAASNRQLLSDYNISHIVNCQDTDGKNYFEGDPELTYLKFCIGRWRSVTGVAAPAATFHGSMP
eukprot:TRINITY_DN32912_c0_g5_i1.p1 TRINITY_DN32912_c0_g5~~TRINITY_DN32912_c0_g5_i1.p1  ORF type:complete len:152 (-),score=20.88 TRINITY_DN32912_c0_g5_i1:48-503(-)